MRTVADLLRQKGPDVQTFDENGTLPEAARAMLDRGIGSLVITSADRAKGILTRNDLVRAIAENADRACTACACDHMTRDIHTTEPRADLQSVRNHMLEHGIHHMPVLDGDTVAGLITLADVLYLELAEAEVMNKTLEAYIYGPYF